MKSLILRTAPLKSIWELLIGLYCPWSHEGFVLKTTPNGANRSFDANRGEQFSG